MDADRRLTKALEAASDALQHLSMSPDFSCLDCTHIDRLVGRVVDLPTEGNQRNSRRNLLVIRQWMVTEGPGVVLLEVLGQLYWRLGELNSKQFDKFKATLQQQQPYLSLIQDTAAVTLVLQRLQHIQRLKAEACQDFLCELSDLTGLKVDSPMADSFDSILPPETGFTSLIKYVPSASAWSGDIEQLLIDFYINGICPGRTVATQSNGYTSLIQVANTCLSTRYALLGLSASYISEYIPSQKAFYQHAELYYSTQALQALAIQITNGEDYDGALATSMLLMHHGAVNDALDSSLCWSCHANVFDIIPDGMIDLQSDPALFLQAQLTFAQTFRLAALIYLRCRIFGLTRFHPSVIDLSETLCTLILSLPVKGALYTAIYPVWPLFIAAVTVNPDKRDRLYQRVVPIREGDKNTLPAVLKRVSGLRIWLAQQDPMCQRKDGWWDEMLNPSSSTNVLGRSLLCLG
ncbi:hypothetical protein E8E11_010102 [Didymella keratinophila]|nr:hypothetical protein E8E11_010102 [Didymella keratinophila]